MPPQFSATFDKVVGVIGLLAGIVMGLSGLADDAGNTILFTAVGVFIGAGALLGVRSIRWGGTPKPTMSAAVLKELARDRAIPFSVCTSCRLVIELPHAFSCPECGLTDCCIAVHEESERSIAMAAIGVD